MPHAADNVAMAAYLALISLCPVPEVRAQAATLLQDDGLEGTELCLSFALTPALQSAQGFLHQLLAAGCAGKMSEITTHSIALSLAAAGLACWCGAGGAGLVGFEGCSLGITALCASGIALVCSGRSWSADGRRRNVFAGTLSHPIVLAVPH